MNFFGPKFDQNLRFFSDTMSLNYVFKKRALHMFWSISVTTFYDPRISQIEKILVKFCRKFLDLYASIQGLYVAGQGCSNFFAHGPI